MPLQSGMEEAASSRQLPNGNDSNTVVEQPGLSVVCSLTAKESDEIARASFRLTHVISSDEHLK